MAAEPSHICPGAQLLDLPNEILLEILRHTFRAADELEIAHRRNAWKTRIAVAGTCRLLRGLSHEVKWGDWGGIARTLDQKTLDWLIEPDETVAFVKLFLLGAPDRLRVFTGISMDFMDFGLDIDMGVELLERFRSVHVPLEPTDAGQYPVVEKVFFISKCFRECLPTMQQPWMLSELVLQYDFNELQWTPEELVDVVDRVSPWLRVFRLSMEFDASGKEAVVSMIRECLAKLVESNVLREIYLEHRVPPDDPCSDRITLKWADLEPLASTLGSIGFGDVHVEIPTQTVPFPNLEALSLRNTQCKHQNPVAALFEAAGSPSIHAVFFPKLTYLTIDPSALPAASSLVHHAPGLSRIFFRMRFNHLNHDFLFEHEPNLEDLLRNGNIPIVVMRLLPPHTVAEIPLETILKYARMARMVRDWSDGRTELGLQQSNGDIWTKPWRSIIDALALDEGIQASDGSEASDVSETSDGSDASDAADQDAEEDVGITASDSDDEDGNGGSDA